MTHQSVILVIDDEPQIRKILRLSLEAEGYTVIEAASGTEGIVLAGSHQPQLIILDLGLPDQDGLTVLRDIRSWSQVPIIILSVRSEEETIITALETGADDYMAKPFSPGELNARIRAALRRSQTGTGQPMLSNGPLRMDLTRRLVFRDDEELKLTNTEYMLIALFFQNIDKVLTRNYILKTVWGPTHTEDSQYLRVFIGQLRKKIEDEPARPKIIVTESGVGYRMKSLG